MESSSKYLIIDIRRRIEAAEAYLKKELQFGLEEGFFGKGGVDSSFFGKRALEQSCEHGNTILFYVMNETGFPWGNLW